MNEKPKSKSGCGCAFGIAGCFTIIALSVVLLIVLTVSAVIWVKHRTYVNQAEKTQEVASKICEYKLPESFTPVGNNLQRQFSERRENGLRVVFRRRFNQYACRREGADKITPLNFFKQKSIIQQCKR